jgi:sugar lactone lactonase YvrE
MFEIRTIADATMEAIQPSQPNDTLSSRGYAWKAVQTGGWRAVRAFVCCVALVAMLVGGARQADAQVRFAGVNVPVITGLNSPWGMAVDASGNIYIADMGATTVYKETPQSDGTYAQTVLDTFNSSQGFSSGPVGIAVDSAGSVFIGMAGACSGQATSCLMKETWNSGTSTWVRSYIGTLPGGVLGVAIDTYGNLFASWAVGSTGKVSKFQPNGSGGYIVTNPAIYSAASATLGGVAVDNSGKVYVTQALGQYFYVLTPTTSAQTATAYTVATSVLGRGGPQFYGIAVDGAGNVYIGDANGFLLEFVPAEESSYTEVVLNSSLSDIHGVTFSPTGILYLNQTNEVDRYDYGSVSLGTQAESSAAPITTSFQFAINSGTSIGSWLVLDQGISGLEFQPVISSCPTGLVNFADTCVLTVKFTAQYPGVRQGAVEALDACGNVLAKVYVSGVGQMPQVALHPGAQTKVVTGLGSTWGNNFAMLTDGSIVSAAHGMTGVIKQASGGAQTDLVASGKLINVNGLAVDGAGNIFVAQAWSSVTSILEIPLTGVGYGTPFTVGSGLNSPNGVAVDGAGNLFVTQGSTNVTEFPWTGGSYGTAVQFGSLKNAASVAVDANRNLFVSDSSAGNVVEIPWTGSGYNTAGQTTIASNLTDPIGVAMDGGGSVYVGDGFGNAGIKLVPLTASGYGTPFVIATGLGTSTGVALDGAGNLYVSSDGVGSITEINVANPIQVTFATATPVGTQDNEYTQSPAVTVLNTGNQELTLYATGSPNPLYPSGFAYDAGSSCDQVSVPALHIRCWLRATTAPMKWTSSPRSVGAIAATSP